MSRIKVKLLNTCERYSKIKVPFKHKKVINNLRQNKNIAILKQDKGKGVVIIDNTKYVQKCMSLLNSDKFKVTAKDPTATIERKIQNALRKIKNKLTDNEYRRLYPTGSSPGKFYGIAKLHKLKANETVDDLPIRPIISNIGTASYETAKYLAKLLSPLSYSEYTVKSTAEFITFIKSQQFQTDHKMVSFTPLKMYYTVYMI